MIKWIGFGVSIVAILFFLVALYGIEGLLSSGTNLANKIDSKVKYLIEYYIKDSDKPIKRFMYNNELEGYAREYIRNHQIISSNEELIAFYDASPKRNASMAAIITTKRVIYYMDSLIASFALKDIDNQFGQDSAGIQIRNSSGSSVRIAFDNNQDKELFLKTLRDTKSKLTVPEQGTTEKAIPFNQDDKLYDSLLQFSR